MSGSFNNRSKIGGAAEKKKRKFQGEKGRRRQAALSWTIYSLPSYVSNSSGAGIFLMDEWLSSLISVPLGAPTYRLPIITRSLLRQHQNGAPVYVLGEGNRREVSRAPVPFQIGPVVGDGGL